MYKNIEEMTLNAWPSLQTMVLDGWLLRFANGYTKRANSIQPIYTGTENFNRKIDLCEEMYAEKGLRTIFKITPYTFPISLDEQLEKRNYEVIEPSSVLVKKLTNLEKPAIHSISISEEVTSEWLDTYCKFSNLDNEKAYIHKAIINNIITRKVFVILYIEGLPAACGLGVVNGDYVGLYDIVTSEHHRRKGYGKQMILHILQWAQRQGISNGYLQVVKNNMTAIKLYKSLGYSEIYDYWYRVKPIT
ncbi:GNAT family N-acetyltransferase [Paenibacillus lemnae]|uniref:GNAT family N-acetyltransferase n=1 Tax=Paenibacillus lemnae TaxID=1330551 RepID=A0A848ME64_PAELE|nr:GNAT family N-acetyltransferase [Paenibacillus lemnae]NMO97694.1 GNAT family N-acetyltransferase [Paenibacillus lemnae]